MPFGYRRKRRFTFVKRRFGYGGIRKRRYVRKRRAYVRGSSKRAARPELKNNWIAPAVNNFNTAWGSAKDITATSIVQGTDANNRIGRVIVVRKLQFLIDVQANPLSILPLECARLVIWRQNSIIGNASSWADLYDNGRQASNQMVVWGVRVPGNRDYTILYDKRIMCSSSASGFSTPATVRHIRRITLRFKKGLRVTYSAGGAGWTENTRPNHLWFNTLGEQGFGTNYPTGLVAYKMWFHDI